MRQLFNRQQRFSIRKLTVGVASVVIGTVFFAQNPVIYADELGESSKVEEIKPKVVETVSSDNTAAEEVDKTNTLDDNKEKGQADEEFAPAEENEAVGLEGKAKEALSNGVESTGKDEKPEEKKEKRSSQDKKDEAASKETLKVEKLEQEKAQDDKETAKNPTEIEDAKGKEFEELSQKILEAKDPKALLKENLKEVYGAKDTEALLAKIDFAKIKDGKSLKEALTNAGLALAEEKGPLSKGKVLAGAEEHEPTDVSDKIELKNFTFKHNAWKPDYSDMEKKDFDPNNPIRSALGEAAFIDFNTEIPEDVKAGDYFIMDYGEYIRHGGIETPVRITPLMYNNYALTEVFFDETNNRIFHKFNKNAEKYKGQIIHYTDAVWQKYDKVTTNNTKYPVTVTVGKKEYKKDLAYDYCNEIQGKKVVFGANINVDDSGDKKRITQVWHVNRYGEKVPDGNHTLLWESNTGETFESMKVYEVLDDRAITDSPNPNPDPKYVKEIQVNPVVGADGKARVDLGDNLAQGKKYIVVTVGNPKKDANSSVDWLSVRNKNDKSRNQDAMGVMIGVNKGDSSGKKNEKPGVFIENHRYETVDEDGNVLKVDDTVTKFPQQGKSDQEYTTKKSDREGYTFKKTENPKNDPTYSNVGDEKKGHFKPSKTQEITYVYQKTQITKGKFQEHHIYQTLDFDGKVIETSTEDKDISEGKKEASYSTAKQDKEGFTLTKVEDTTEGKSEEVKANFNAEGNQTSGNYIPGKKLDVTYTYVKRPGRFQEHHIYQTTDSEGKEIKDETIKDDKPVSEDFKEKQFTTKQQPKDGYKLVKVTADTKGTNKNDDGKEAKTNYKPGVKQEVTYVYQKMGKFQEHHIYQTVDEDGNVVTEDGTIDGAITEDVPTEQFDTSGKPNGTTDKPKEGYKLVKVSSKYEAEFKPNGDATKGHYIAGKTQEVTYVYQKTVKTKGSFQEHHIYVTKDQEGVEVSRITEDGEETTGKKNEKYTTSKKEKEGFKLVKVETPVEEPTYNI